MAWENRSYYRDPPPAHMGVGGMGDRPVTNWLMGLCIGIFVVDAVIARMMGRHEVIGNGPLTDWGNLSAAKAVFSGQVWRLVTFQFLHTGLLHLIFNLIFGLYFFGRMIEPAMGSRRYLAYYLLSGVAGGALFLLLVWLGNTIPNAGRVPGLLVGDTAMPLVGASAGCYGILVAAAVLYPHESVRIWPLPITLSVRSLVIILIAFSAFWVLVNNTPGHAGEAAHLGGALLGYVLMRYPRLLNFVPEGRFNLPFLPKNDWASKQARLDKQREKEEAEVDRILDKVRAKGLHSLTRSEQKALQRATKRSAARDA